MVIGVTSYVCEITGVKRFFYHGCDFTSQQRYITHREMRHTALLLYMHHSCSAHAGDPYFTQDPSPK